VKSVIEKNILAGSILEVYTQAMEVDRPKGPATYTAKDVRKVAGLSYRQLNDWEAKGLIPRTRTSQSGWRRFTADQVFVIAILADLRSTLNVSLSKLSRLSRNLLEHSPPIFRSAVFTAFHESQALFLGLHPDFTFELRLSDEYSGPFAELLQSHGLLSPVIAIVDLGKIVVKMYTSIEGLPLPYGDERDRQEPVQW